MNDFTWRGIRFTQRMKGHPTWSGGLWAVERARWEGQLGWEASWHDMARGQRPRFIVVGGVRCRQQALSELRRLIENGWNVAGGASSHSTLVSRPTPLPSPPKAQPCAACKGSCLSFDCPERRL